MFVIVQSWNKCGIMYCDLRVSGVTNCTSLDTWIPFCQVLTRSTDPSSEADLNRVPICHSPSPDSTLCWAGSNSVKRSVDCVCCPRMARNRPASISLAWCREMTCRMIVVCCDRHEYRIRPSISQSRPQRAVECVLSGRIKHVLC